MALYALQAAYTPTAWAALVNAPENRLDAVRPVVDGWMSFGDYDVLLICEMPDQMSAAALSMAISAGGAVKDVKTTPLLTFDEGVAALGNAKSAEYAAPSTEVPYFGVYHPKV
jgi:uncharacterized protein with GYD domain